MEIISLNTMSLDHHYDRETGEQTDGFSVELVGGNFSLKDIKPDTLPQVHEIKGVGDSRRAVNRPAESYELSYVLSKLKSGRAIDSSKFVVIDRPPNAHGNSNVQRVYKKGSVRLMGRRMVEKYGPGNWV